MLRPAFLQGICQDRALPSLLPNRDISLQPELTAPFGPLLNSTQVEKYLNEKSVLALNILMPISFTSANIYETESPAVVLGTVVERRDKNGMEQYQAVLVQALPSFLILPPYVTVVYHCPYLGFCPLICKTGAWRQSYF